MDDYWTPLATVPSWEFEGYLDALEHTLEEKLDEKPEYRPHTSVTSPDIYARNEIEGMERRIYRDLLDGLEEVENKTDLMQYSKEVVDGPASVFPAPLNLFTEAVDRIFRRGTRSRIVQDIFEEAREELEP